MVCGLVETLSSSYVRRKGGKEGGGKEERRKGGRGLRCLCVFEREGDNVREDKLATWDLRDAS